MTSQNFICHILKSELSGYQWQVGELALGSQEWDSGSCSLPAAAHRRAGPAALLGRSRAGLGDVAAGEPDLRTRVQNWPCSLLPAALGELLGTVLERWVR